jgi:hypothetical protein
MKTIGFTILLLLILLNAGTTQTYSGYTLYAKMGNNLKEVSGKYLIFTGDVNQAGIINSTDLTQINSTAANYLTGYISTDINRDGLFDAGDMILVDNNASNF